MPVEKNAKKETEESARDEEQIRDTFIDGICKSDTNYTIYHIPNKLYEIVYGDEWETRESGFNVTIPYAA